jgi:hypothetical protein
MTTPSAKMTKRYTDTLLIFQISFVYRAKFSYFVIFSASVLGRLWVKGTAISITSAIFFSVDEHYIGSAETYCLISYDRPVSI